MERETMLGKLVGKIYGLPQDFLGSLWDLVQRLVGKEGRVWLVELNHYLRKEATWTKRLLKLDTVVDLPANPEFQAEQFIKAGKVGEMKVVFGNNFKAVFGTTVEKNIPEITARVHRLEESPLGSSSMWKTTKAFSWRSTAAGTLTSATGGLTLAPLPARASGVLVSSSSPAILTLSRLDPFWGT